MNEMDDVNIMMFNLVESGEEEPSVERLLNEFEAHEAKEEGSLEIYKKTLSEVKDPVTRFLLQMIVSDEEKHRAVVHAMAVTLKGSLTWTKPSGSLEGGSDTEEVNARLRAATEEMIRVEKEGIKEYKNLVEQSSGYYHGLFKILLDSMIRDSEKHVELLEFLKGQIRSR